MFWKDHQPTSPAPAVAASAEAIQAGVICIRVSCDVRLKAAWEASNTARIASRTSDSSQLKPLNRAKAAAAGSTAALAAQAASSRRDRPNASNTSTRPRIEDTKWLISIRITGACSASHMNRIGSDGVAPDASNIAPAAAVSRANRLGAAARIAGCSSRSQRIGLLPAAVAEPVAV